MSIHWDVILLDVILNTVGDFSLGMKLLWNLEIIY